MVLKINTFIKSYAEKKAVIEEALPKYLPAEQEIPSVITQAMRYAVLNGGKRMRPILCLEAASLFSNDNNLLPAACALEYIHCYSLVHDDLPAMDNDDLRRGKPTCHKVYGEDLAILAGDALLTLGFEIMASAEAPAEARAKAIRILGDAAGWRGMVGGQVIDLSAVGQSLSPYELDEMHRKKTGALITASLQIGGILRSASDTELNKLANYGQSLGLAFQIMDDILDIEGDVSLLGKPVGSDQKNQKTTYVTLYGVQDARKLAEKYTSEAIEALSGFGERADFLRQIAQAQLTRQF